MIALMLVIHIFLGATLAGSAVVAALVLGFDGALPIVTAAAVGFFAALPVSWLIAKRLTGSS